MADDKKKTSIKPYTMPSMIDEPFPERVYDDQVILTNGMSMEEIANDPELLKEYTEAQNKLYVERLVRQKQNEADSLNREREKNSTLPFNSNQEMLEDLKKREWVAEDDE